MMGLEPKKSSLSHLVVDEGEVENIVLKSIDKDEAWLKEKLKEAGYEEISNIYYAEWSEANGLIVNSYND